MSRSEDRRRAKAGVRDLSRAVAYLRRAWRALEESAEHLSFGSSDEIIRGRSQVQGMVARLQSERDRIASEYGIPDSEYEHLEEDPGDG